MNPSEIEFALARSRGEADRYPSSYPGWKQMPGIEISGGEAASRR